MDSISQSRIKTLLACPRKFYFRYKLGLIPKEKSSALIDGTILHKAVEKHYSLQEFPLSDHQYFKYVSWGFPEDKLKYLAVILDELEPLEIPSDRKARLIGMFASYVMIYPRDEFLSYNPEEKIEFHWRGTNITAILDNVVEMKDTGDLRLMEIKTTSSRITDRAERIADDIQHIFYMWAYYLKHQRMMDGVHFRILQKCRLRQKYGESFDTYTDRVIADYIRSPEKYVSDVFVKKNVDDLAWFEEELLQHIEDMGRERKTWVRNTQRCFDYGGCEYYALCDQNEINQGMVEEMFEKKEE